MHTITLIFSRYIERSQDLVGLIVASYVITFTILCRLVQLLQGIYLPRHLRVPIKYWRSMGYKVVTCLDDGIGGDVDYVSTLNLRAFVQRSLRDFGFLLVDGKYNWVPCRMGSWLGHIIDFSCKCLFIADNRRVRLEKSIQSLYCISSLQMPRLLFLPLPEMRPESDSVHEVSQVDNPSRNAVVGSTVTVQSLDLRRVSQKLDLMRAGNCL